MGIDAVGAGFNPHLLSDQSPVNAAISALVLPSSFRPVADPASPTGSRWELDTSLLESAEVTDDNPFTVTYKIRPEAQWTDNAPIAADDFWYLWRQMVSQPGVVDPAGYDMITGVQSIDGGKTAVVTFSQPYPAWRELFNDIVPAHIVKDVPGGFLAGLAQGDAGHRRTVPRREHRPAARRDPAGPQRPLLGSSRPNRTRSCSAAQAHPPRWPTPSATATPRSLRCTAAQPLSRNSRPSPMSGPHASSRRGSCSCCSALSSPNFEDVPSAHKHCLGLLDVDLLAAVGAGSDNTVTLAQAQVRSPSDPGYVPTSPPAMTQDAALALLADCGLCDRPGHPVVVLARAVGRFAHVVHPDPAARGHPWPDQQGRSAAGTGHRGRLE